MDKEIRTTGVVAGALVVTLAMGAIMFDNAVKAKEALLIENAVLKEQISQRDSVNDLNSSILNWSGKCVFNSDGKIFYHGDSCKCFKNRVRTKNKNQTNGRKQNNAALKARTTTIPSRDVA